MTEREPNDFMELKLRQAEQRLNDRLDDLRRRVEELRSAQADLTAAVLARIDAHEDYHRRNEHRWGLIRLAGRHPFRLVALTLALAWLAPDSGEWIAATLRELMRTTWP